MLVMLCTRCQQREAKVWLAEHRARLEADFGTPWPFPDGLCRECLREWFKSAEGKERMEPFMRAMDAKFRRDVERWKQNARSAALKVLDVADAIAGKL
jgi:hypothetical protein